MSMLQEVVARKRDGESLTAAEIERFVAAIADGSACEAQVGAFAMAVRLRGMDAGETLALTLAMRDSGSVLDWDALPLDGPVVDKHSTGGVGDTVSLMLGPMLAACGAYVPMISGRGLGHTGGTLDKLEAIPGYATTVGAARLQRVVREAGVAIVGAGAELAPADRRLYAIRDVTATVDSIALITASILAKKLAERPQALVLDVKCGGGATLPDAASATMLAQSLVDVATRCGVRACALLTDMDEPLAPAIGNATELRVALRYLRGDERPPRLHAITLALGAALLHASGIDGTVESAGRRLIAALDSGGAAQRFAHMVALLGGPPDLLDRREALVDRAPVIRPVTSAGGGHVVAMDARALGRCVVALGGGRARPDDQVDHRVGLDRIVPIGGRVEPGQPLAWVHARDEQAFMLAERSVREAIRTATAPPPERPLVIARVGAPVDPD
jgi:thymidine phosphorylase